MNDRDDERRGLDRRGTSAGAADRAGSRPRCPRRRGRRRSLAGLAATGALLLGACGDDGGRSAATSGTAAAPTAAPATAAAVASSVAATGGYGAYAVPPTTAAGATAATGGAPTLALGDSALGRIVVGDRGMTVYAYTQDSGSTSTCYDACAEGWPPVLVADASAPTLGAGLDAAKLATAPRKDGGTQVTYAGHPLYFFAGDGKPGDTSGENAGEVWFVLDASGALVPPAG